MTGPDRAQVREVFLAASSLPPPDRPAYLAEACRDDEPLRREVESLLDHHDDRTLIAARRGPTSRRGPAVALGVSVVLGAIVLVGHELAEGRLDRRAREALDLGVRSASNAVDGWLRDEVESLRGVTASPEVEAAVERLLEGGDVETAHAEIAPRLPRGSLGYALLSEDAELLVVVRAGERPERGGSLNQAGRDLLERMQRSRLEATPLAFPRGSLLEGEERDDARVLAIAAPVGGAWCVVAVEGGPLERRLDATASYVVDAAGVSLTRSPERGLDLLAPVRRPDGRPTRAVEAVCGGKDGLDSDGYPDARGVRVLGAWRWRPEWSIGVVTEVDAASVLAPLRPWTLARRAAWLAVAVALVGFVWTRR
ncbi:MAG: hypothetical protein ACF8XB_21460 [Planctomycetota bacterium JB042]